MGEILPPKFVLPLLAVSSRHPDAFDWAFERMAQAFGKVEKASERFEFDQTDYYEATMGPGLSKQFFVAQHPFDPAKLSQWKVETNGWEEQYRETCSHTESRPLNLDPGFISEDKLVLASTKNHAHRIYLDHGIYAEITLQYRQKTWQKLPWTYPDYQQASFQAFFTEARNYLRQQLRAMS